LNYTACELWYKLGRKIMIVILAHGILGEWDELVFLGVIVIFLGVAFVSWFRSRSMDYEDADLLPQNDEGDGDEERYRLE
jgi:hypothetical protein